MTKKARKKLTFWVPPEKHAAIKKAAEDDRRSMTAWVMLQIERALEEAKPGVASTKGGKRGRGT
jgi:predicted HicB family RNase H-like nuclease